jgi:hypothetical protein
MDVIGFPFVSLGSSTVQLRDNLDSRRACAYSGPVLVVKMATMIEVCTNEEQRLLCGFCGQKDVVQRIFIKEFFPVYGRKSLSHKAGHSSGWQTFR